MLQGLADLKFGQRVSMRLLRWIRRAIATVRLCTSVSFKQVYSYEADIKRNQK